MSAINDGGPAFPCGAGRYIESPPGTHTWYQPPTGMSLRDWFAGQALVAIIVVPAYRDTPGGTANMAYDLADAMLAEREKGGK